MALVFLDSGPSLLDWCEPNYVYSNFIAEFFNTWTNLPYIFIGFITMFNLPPSSVFQRVKLAGLALSAIGFGSMYFHGTLTRRGQAADELAIVYWEASLLFTLLETRLNRIFGRNSTLQWIGLLFLLFCETVLYGFMDVYPQLGWALYHPLHVSVSIINVGLLSLNMNNCKRTAFLIKLGLTLIAIAFAAWLLDMFACESTKHLHLHAFGWHFLSAAAIACLHSAVVLHVARENNIARVSIFGIELGSRQSRKK